jgi:hypothetical protein
MKSKAPKLPPTLQDVTYTSIGDDYFYGDSVAPQHGGPSAKFLYLTVGKQFYKAVAKHLVEWVPEFTSKIFVNAGGPAVAGDVSMAGWAYQHTLYTSLIFEHEKGHAQLYWRIGKRTYGVDGANRWIVEPNATPGVVANAIHAVLKTLVPR